MFLIKSSEFPVVAKYKMYIVFLEKYYKTLFHYLIPVIIFFSFYLPLYIKNR
jgi:hypothetical protein